MRATDRKSIMSVLVLAVLAFGLTACEQGANSADREVSERILKDLQQAHPVPMFDRSQERQNLVELTTARAQSTATTSFFFNLGIADPITVCPSTGFPIPATMQLTNPEARAYSSAAYTVPQVEPTGVYTGDTTGTYVMCIDAQGNGYAQYWEGFVSAVTGPAEWNAQTKQIQLIGPPSFEFTTDVGEVTVDDAPAEVPADENEQR